MGNYNSGNFVKISREIIEMKNIPPTRTMIYNYLCCNRSLIDCVNFTVNDIVVKCGYSVDYHKGKINDRVVKILKLFEKLNYYSLISGRYTGDNLCMVKLNIEKFDIPSSFALIYISEIDAILNYKSEKRNVSADKIITILSYIRVNKARRTEHQNMYPHKKPEMYYRQIKSIAEETNIAYRTVINSINILRELDIVVTKEIPRYKDEYDNWHTDVTIFVDKYDGWEQELEWGESLLKSGKSIKYNQNDC